MEDNLKLIKVSQQPLVGSYPTVQKNTKLYQMKDNLKIIELKTSATNCPIFHEVETNTYGNKPKCTKTLNEKYLK